MSRSERSSTAALLFALALAGALAAGARRAEARPWLCLPPVFEGGQRLQPLTPPHIFWLPLLLRQHELCWRPLLRPAERRIVLLGNSAVFGFPLDVEKTFGSLLNRHFAERGIPAHLYNLGFVTTYQVRDALILHEALAYQPDVIVYPLSLDDFLHLAPLPYLLMMQFFDSNRSAMSELIADPPAGLEEPFGLYRRDFLKHPDPGAPIETLRETGAYLRAAVRAAAEWFFQRFNSPLPPFDAGKRKRKTKYDCSDTEWKTELNLQNWKTWNVLAYLQQLHEELGIEVLVVNWPVAHEPIGVCYNVRFTNAVLQDFVQWMAEQTRERGLSYLDLHDLLPPERFFDSLHPTAEGHALIAAAVQSALDPILSKMGAREVAASDR